MTIPGEHLGGVVGRPVGRDDDLHTIARIVRRQQVVDSSRQPLRLVPRRYDDRNPWQVGGWWLVVGGWFLVPDP